MTNNNETRPHRRFHIIRPGEASNIRICAHCRTDFVGCPECEEKGLIPNAVGLTHISAQYFHHGTCFRHGAFWRRCSHYTDAEQIGEHAGARIERGRVIRIVIAFTVAAFWIGLLAGVGIFYVQRAIFAH